MTFNFDFSYWNWAEIRSLKQRLAQMGVPIVLDFHVCAPWYSSCFPRIPLAEKAMQPTNELLIRDNISAFNIITKTVNPT